MRAPLPGCPDFQRLGVLRRREFLRAGSLALLGMTLPRMLEAQALAASRPRVPGAEKRPWRGGSFGRAKRCILLFMWGGPAQQDTWDMKPDAPQEYRGPFQPIS